MSIWRQITRGLRTLTHRKAADEDVADEIQDYFEQTMAAYRERGMSAEEARRAARLEIGNPRQVREQVQSYGWENLIGRFFADLRYAVRQLRRSPGFAAVSILTLALGIGGNTAIFGVIDEVLIKMLPVKNPQELVTLGARDERGTNFGGFSYPAFLRIRDRNEVFSGIFANEQGVRTLEISFTGQSTKGANERVKVKLVSGAYFSMLGVNAILGRTFTEDADKVAGANPVAVVSYGYWKRRLGLDPSVLGKTFIAEQTVFTIIGVAPPGFFGVSVGEAPDMWVPVTMKDQLDNEASLNASSMFWLEILARLKPGIEAHQAASGMSVLLKQVNGELMGPKAGTMKVRAEIKPASKGFDALRARFSRPLEILMGAVALVLLVACVSVASLLTARATARQKEIAVRVTLGASTRRLLQQLFTESILLAFAGGLLGLLLTWWMNHLLPTLLFDRNTSLNLTLNTRILGFTAVVSMVTGIIFGLTPALQVLRPNLTYGLKEDRGGRQGNRLQLGWRKMLIVTQVALSILLLMVAGLFVRSLQKLNDVETGFKKENLLLVRLEPGADLDPVRLKSVYQNVLEKVSALPAVRSCSVSMGSFADGGMHLGPVAVEGYSPRVGEDTTLDTDIVSPGFLGTMGIPMLLGRDFRAQDDSTAPRVAIVNETFARYYFGSQNPLGKHLALGRLDRRPMEIIGVARDAKYGALKEQTPRFYYTSFFQQDMMASVVRLLEVRTLADPAAVAAEVRATAGSVTSSLRVDEITTMVVQVEDSLRQQSMLAKLSSSFGLFALLLACIGLYGLMSYAVTCRTNEIGIRMALGAERSNVLWMMLREGFLLALAGVAIGIPAALAATRLASNLISGLLFEVKLGDPRVILASAFIMTVVALVAGYLPARRAAHTDPLTAIRCE